MEFNLPNLESFWSNKKLLRLRVYIHKVRHVKLKQLKYPDKLIKVIPQYPKRTYCRDLSIKCNLQGVTVKTGAGDRTRVFSFIYRLKKNVKDVFRLDNVIKLRNKLGGGKCRRVVFFFNFPITSCRQFYKSKEKLFHLEAHTSHNSSDGVVHNIRCGKLFMRLVVHQKKLSSSFSRLLPSKKYPRLSLPSPAAGSF